MYLVGMEGQLTVFPNRGGPTACYHCLYPNPPADEACKSCANAGVLGPVPGVIGTIQAIEVLKILTHPEVLDSARGETLDKQGRSLVGRQLYYDATCGEFHNFDLRPRRTDCPSCGSGNTLHHIPQNPPDAPPPSPLSVLHAALSSAHRVSARTYFTDVLSADSQHLLIDVRSTLQFDMISLEHLFVGSSRKYILNLPYEHMTRVDPAQLLCLVSAALAKTSCAVSEAENSDGPGVYVICRRGNDSVRATLLLLSALRSNPSISAPCRLNEANLLNIDGGLHAWSNQVDHHFPAY